jgi:transcriptional regulator with XRE-family HTH domain
MSDQKTVKSGVAMVQISGSTLRALREKQNLTQLYLATAVGVTTETISRWERQDAPTLKEENAVKLADVLAVPLQDMLDSVVEEIEEDSRPVVAAGFFKNNRTLVIAAAALVLGILVFVLIKFGGGDVHNISAKRIIPAHSVPGHIFPVLLEVELESEDTISLLLKEELPQGCSVVHTIPQATAVDHGFVKWVARNVSGLRLFSYLVRCLPDIQNKEPLFFKGLLLVRQSRRQEIVISGRSKLRLLDFHWADSDKNNVIDDEELLAVYDDFDLVKELNIDVEEIESIWMGSGYIWNAKQSAFEIIP